MSETRAAASTKKGIPSIFEHGKMLSQMHDECEFE